jgi:putative hemin transport protein
MNTQITALQQAWQALKATEPGIRIRNAAEKLKVSELELLSTETGNRVTILRPEFQALLGSITSLGKVMALTRNQEVVHERKGIYVNPELNNPHVGLFTGKDIDLRIFFSAWKYAVAVEDESPRGIQRSLQFFSHTGEAIHKIFLTPHSVLAAWEIIREQFKAEDQSPIQILDRNPAESVPELADESIEVTEFRKAWLGLQDTHDFFGMLKKFKVSRLQALRLAPDDMAVLLKTEALIKCLEGAAHEEVSIMAFVGNPGMIQIHSGPIQKLFPQGDWFNVMDPDFNLHIYMLGIQQVWLVRKPTRDGMVTAIECFNAKGEQVLQLFGERKPGISELKSWRLLTAQLDAQFSV